MHVYYIYGMKCEEQASSLTSAPKLNHPPNYSLYEQPEEG
jgi:hypothetical protein